MLVHHRKGEERIDRNRQVAIAKDLGMLIPTFTKKRRSTHRAPKPQKGDKKAKGKK